MVSDRFEALFRDLTQAFVVYHDVDRSPDNIPELGAARWNLVRARRAIGEERQQIRRNARPVAPLKVGMSQDNLSKLQAVQSGADGR